MQGKKILIGITGSIAAYKLPELVRLLIKAGAEVKVVMTPAAANFVSPLVLSTLSRNKVLIEMFEENTWSNHVMLGRWADLFVIAPLSCNTLAKMVNGICDNFLLAVYLSATCKVMIAPAMDEDMWHHFTTQKNLKTLHEHGVYVMNTEHGELASGLTGQGRMAEPQTIFANIQSLLRNKILLGKKVLITSGPTHEALDPVRFIGNYSSGKMGAALAEALYMQGAEVIFISGPGGLKPLQKDIQVVNVTSAEEMYEAVHTHFSGTDIAILAAAVADYKPATKETEKIKKAENTFTLELHKTKDILASLGKIKSSKQLLVGFALETQNEKENALKKLENKKADFIVLNSLQDEGAGFGKDTNKVTVFDKEGNEYPSALASKKEIARFITNILIQHIDKS